jgi:hypothetical protein
MGTLGYSDASQRAMLDEVLRREREFHDAWATGYMYPIILRPVQRQKIVLFSGI